MLRYLSPRLPPNRLLQAVHKKQEVAKQKIFALLTALHINEQLLKMSKANL